MTRRAVFILTLRPEPAGTDRYGREPTVRLRGALKVLLRAFGLRCIDVREGGTCLLRRSSLDCADDHSFRDTSAGNRAERAEPVRNQQGNGGARIGPVAVRVGGPGADDADGGQALQVSGAGTGAQAEGTVSNGKA
jgi:hypothetical protein